ncbi:ABC transporter substrate-binding protein [Umezawaea beigongshangensis]|uniref:ABC transporter substrate-binding protein n=1 Tax=Umezawaea beigongshangensis TaxID=2780383 RepID=UPI0018F1335D|nr:ABC transporter substrate-binding protein [Umezawaea beigongshangensis]
MTTGEPKRYHWGFIPRRGRWPKRWTDWIRLCLVVLLVATTALVARYAGTVADHVRCKDGWPGPEVWQSGDECVGLTQGPYAFELPAFEQVMRVIDQQNRSAAEQCDAEGVAVTVGVLLTMTDQYAGARAVHELEGVAAGQRRANGTGCLHPVRLLVGNIGAYGTSDAPVEVARKLAERPEVVAVAGIGLSDEQSARTADLFAGAKLPMVSDLITAGGFDQSGSREDQPDFRSCERDYSAGIGRDHYYRVAFRNAVQISRLGAAAPQRPAFIMVPTGGSDPYTCTALPMMQREFGGDITEVKFDPGESSTVPQTARRVCGVAGEVTVAYIARGLDLARFLFSLDEAYASGQCAASSVTVLSTSDGQRLRARELNPVLEDLRVKALGSASYRDGRVRLLSTLVGGADKAGPHNPGFTEFEQVFTDSGFDPSHIDAGWAVNAYDAMTTVAAALRTLPTGQAVHRSEVNTAISGFSAPDQAVLGAGGPITFDNSGNRTGDGPPVVHVCPLAPDSDSDSDSEPGRVRSVEVRQGEPLPRC